MGGDFAIFLLFLFVLAVIARQNFVFTLLYFFAGAYILGGWWSKNSIKGVSIKRKFNSRVFLNEEVPVELEISNKSWLPIIYMRINESLPAQLVGHTQFKQVFSLRAHSKVGYSYLMHARKRGFYKVGPFYATSGDLLGLFGERRIEGLADYLIVYPKIISLSSFSLPSRSPQGIMRHTQPIFEDPTRVLSKRDYVVGDSLRRVDWKTTASTGRLQVKQFEPSIALETVIFLNLNVNEYDLKQFYDNVELAIVVAASVANWVTGEKQSVGLITNGLDALGIDDDRNNDQIDSVMMDQPGRALLPTAKPIPSRKGRAHLMRILDVLARVVYANTVSMVELFKKEYNNLPWGTTVILITGLLDEVLFDQLFQGRRAGLNVVIIHVGNMIPSLELRQRAHHFKFPLYLIRKEQDLDVWRK